MSTARASMGLTALIALVGCGRSHLGLERSPDPHTQADSGPWSSHPHEGDGDGDSEPAPGSLDAGTSCPGSLTACDQSCVDLASNPDHCGDCWQSCGGAPCQDGVCQAPCLMGQVACGDACVDTLTSAQHCGACDQACASSQVCRQGRCGCAEGEIECGGSCTDVKADTQHCGGCDKTCDAGLICREAACVVPTADWPTLAADMRRTGRNELERGTPPLTEDWAVSLVPAELNPVVVEGNRVFATSRQRFGMRSPLLALALESGSQLWAHDFGSVSSMGQPTVVDGHVYVAQAAGTELPAAFWTFAAASGDVEWTHEVDSQWDNFWAPTVAEQRVYTQGGEYSGLWGFGARDGSLLFTNDQLEQYDEWSSALYDSKVYSFVSGNLRAHDPQTGHVDDMLTVTWNWAGWSMLTAPVITETGVVYLVAPPTLYAFQLPNKQLLWSNAANFAGMPALAGQRVLALDSQFLSAHDASTGTQLWQCLDAPGIIRPPVSAAGFAYVSSATNTYAVDLDTGKVVWQVPFAGWLTIAGGRLLIASADGMLHAYQLAQP